jgi:PIN domain nuclease of toxin-antitoxin system
LPFVRIALDEELAFIGGLIVARDTTSRSVVGDRACLALANELGVRAITANRAWPRIGSAIGVEIELICGYPH